MGLRLKMTSDILRLKKQLSILVQLGLYDHAEIWSSTFCVRLDVELTEKYMYISWYRFDATLDSHLTVF